MYFYEVAILESPIILTYSSKESIEIGSFLDVSIKNTQKIALTLREVEKPPFKTKDIDSIRGEYLSQSYLKIADFISKYYFCELYQSIKLFLPFDREFIFKEKTLNFDIKLSTKQMDAFEYILERKISLLFGDTGSGKTEIYIELIKKAINSGKSAILLMPEISLTPQMEERLKGYFGDLVGIWHSKIGKKAKSTLLESIKNGDIKLLIGARSALFLPMVNLDLIIVDEEHDDSYKSSQKPKINVRDLAIYFGKVLNIRVVLGSATPNVTTYKKFDTFRLKGRFFESKKQIFFEDSPLELSENILNKIENTLIKGSQVIIFLPTRANFKYLFCDSCRSILQCPHCSIGLSFHKKSQALICHYCSYTTRIIDRCPSCDSELKSNRIGTSEVVELLEERFSDKVIQKFDRDEIKSDRALRDILKKFNTSKIDILVGTQMISKGHDYHNIDLAVILGIDSLLGSADFRASEKVLSLVLQIAGRSGRRRDGDVLIQTQNIEFFKRYLGDYERFILDDLGFREGFYPPFKRLVRVLFSHSDKKKAFDSMNEMVCNLKRFDRVEIVGFKEAEIEKIANKYRYNILLRGDDVNYMINSIRNSKTKYCEIDIDPVNFS